MDINWKRGAVKSRLLSICSKIEPGKIGFWMKGKRERGWSEGDRERKRERERDRERGREGHFFQRYK